MMTEHAFLLVQSKCKDINIIRNCNRCSNKQDLVQIQVSIPLFLGNCHILVSSQIVSIRLFCVAPCRRYARHAIYHSKEVLQYAFTCFKDSEKSKCVPSRTRLPIISIYIG
jgi:hypothetical protein